MHRFWCSPAPRLSTLRPKTRGMLRRARPPLQMWLQTADGVTQTLALARMAILAQGKTDAEAAPPPTL